MGNVTLTNASDSYVDAQTPNKNYASGGRLYVGGSGAKIRYSFLYFGRPFKLGVTIQSATLRFWLGNAKSGTFPIVVGRVKSKWTDTKIKASNDPGTTGTTKTATLTSPAAKTMVEVDVTAMMQSVASGADWYGFRLSSVSTTLQWIFSAQGPSAYRPELEISWSDAPVKPSILNPSNGQIVSTSKPTLSFDFTDYSGDRTMQSARIQLSSTSSFTTPLFDTSEYLTSAPEIDMSQTFSRSITVTATAASTAITSAGLFLPTDTGAAITGTGIPAGATLTYVNASSATLSAAATTTGSRTATLSEAWAGLSSGVTIYWRVQTRDGSGLWSAWSDPANFAYNSPGSLSLVYPAASPSNFVEDTSPLISWNFTGRTQKSFQVLLKLKDSGATDMLYVGPKMTDTDMFWTIPKGYVKSEGVVYTVIVRVWDTLNRVPNSSATAYVQVSRDFTFNLNAAVSPVTSLAVTQDNPYPWAKITWSRASAPDAFTIVRDGEAIDSNIFPLDLLVDGSSTNYIYYDRLVDPRINHTWQVWAVENGQVSASNPKLTTKTNPHTLWIYLPDGSMPVVLWNYEVSPQMSNLQELYEPLGGDSPVLISQFLRGYEGSATGTIDVDGLGAGSPYTGSVMRNYMKYYAAHPGIQAVLLYGDEALSVSIYDVTYKSRVKGGNKVIYDVSFSFFQNGSFQ